MDLGTTSPLESPALDRRVLLKTAGISSLAVAATASSADAAPAPGRGPTPWSLDFSVVRRQRPVDLVARGFVQLRDRFEDRSERYERLSPTGRPGRVRLQGGHLKVTGTSFFTLFRSTTRQVAPYAAVVVDVARGGTAQGTVMSGLVKDADNYVVAWYDQAAGSVGLDVSVGGEVQTLATAEASLQRPFQLGFGLTSTTVVALVDDGSGFRPLAKGNLAGIVDLRRPAALAQWRNGFGVRAPSGTVVLDGVTAGYFGQLGLRDPHLVTRADGTPYLKDGKAYLTFTQAGLGFFETAHWGVWTMDVRTFELKQVANLFFQRDGERTVLGDHAGHIVFDDRSERWIIANSTWGDFTGESVQVNYVTLPERRSPLRGVHVLRTRRLPLPVAQLPSAAVGQWDPHLTRIGRRWYVAFVNAREFFNFYPALARSRPGEDFTDLRLVGADDDKVETEGTVLQKFGDRWYVLASNGDASPAAIRGRYPVYDLTMRQVGRLDAPHPTNIPWPMVIPVPLRNNRTRWLMVTFNGTQLNEELLGYGTHGDLIVMRAERTTYGHPFKPLPR
ncbi:hypothetical protein LRP67_08025 [Nocardioides sp. cx-169]|uniref:hypothetical protein n=1 Tax=Nocardioides sp. cx-169 TaxID=2899080 RepID=UPI001E51BE8E|nr:hypothetical protein [Nocardioides sp. cx-169]MCD4534024.1 hypothetical protein [Nocardioides sp. cx-169]